ncbi:unnamed protein product [Bursaphelenchus okinawaensis]|uniref:GH16 domain-containing protein n=1 Tax=Bursaphelenchus okinawaensis TaxID=465554 RepID=A0A811LES0_9BILA|nr:unnamed protein product [Bursaphelenchus okinawaensis]CAG9121868.1 unnamed protein product [Bursaphelenchus okinawaensis]
MSPLYALLFLTAVSAQSIVWQDEFDTLDTTKWNYDLGNGVNGWGNAELEYYTDSTSNVYVDNGNLVIEAIREDSNGFSFTSGKLTTLGKYDFLYGTIVARIKIPSITAGLWPAFWMLGSTSDTWPEQGEIDIMEYGAQAALAAGTGNTELFGTFHWESNGAEADYGLTYTSPTDMSADYHIYNVTWTESLITMYVDGIQYQAMDISAIPTFQKNFYFIINLAVGGNFPAITDPNGITAPLPAQLLVDYIRVYQ